MKTVTGVVSNPQRIATNTYFSFSLGFSSSLFQTLKGSLQTPFCDTIMPTFGQCFKPSKDRYKHEIQTWKDGFSAFQTLKGSLQTRTEQLRSIFRMGRFQTLKGSLQTLPHPKVDRPPQTNFKPSKDRYKLKVDTETAKSWLLFQTLKGSLQTFLGGWEQDYSVDFKPSKDRYKPSVSFATHATLLHTFQTLKGSLQTGEPIRDNPIRERISNPQRIATNTMSRMASGTMWRISNPQRIATNGRGPGALSLQHIAISNPQRIATNRWRSSRSPWASRGISNPQRIATNNSWALFVSSLRPNFKPSKDRYKPWSRIPIFWDHLYYFKPSKDRYKPGPRPSESGRRFH